MDRDELRQQVRQELDKHINAQDAIPDLLARGVLRHVRGNVYDVLDAEALAESPAAFIAAPVDSGRVRFSRRPRV